jgi:hypothetical protein
MVKYFRFPEAPVEAVREFRQVTGLVLWADTMMNTTNIAVDISDQGVDPRQNLRRLLPRTGNEPFMAVGQSIQEAGILANCRFWPPLLPPDAPLPGSEFPAADSREHMYNSKSGLFFGVSTAITTLALRAALRPRFPGLGALN